MAKKGLGALLASDDLLVLLSRGFTFAGLFFLPLLRFHLTKGLNVSDGLFTAAFILLIASRRPPKPAPRTPAWYVGAFLFVICGLVASTQDPASKAASLIVVANSVYVLFVLQYLLRQLLDTELRIQRAMGAVVFGATVSAFVAILQTTLHVFLPAQVTTSISGGNSRAIGLSTQPNLAAVSFDLALVFAVGLLMVLGFRKHKYLGVCILVLIAALLLSGSVGGMGAAIVGLLLLFVLRGVRLRAVVSVVLAIAVVYVVVFGVIDRSSHLNPITRVESTLNSQTSGGTGTFALRIDTISVAWSGFVQKPITGHGLDQGTLAPFWDQFTYEYFPPHNIVFVYLYGGGFFMLVAVIIMMGSSFNRLLSGRRKRGRANTGTRDIVLAGCVTVLVYSMSGPELVDRWLWLPFILALCFRDPVPAETLTAMTTANADAAPRTPEIAAGSEPRRVTGRVGRHAATSSE